MDPHGDLVGQRTTEMARHVRSASGFTLVELLIMIAVIAVLSGAAISLLHSGHSQSAAEEAARRIAADIAFVQIQAITNRTAYTIHFTDATESYGVYAGGTQIRHPVSKQLFQVDFARLFPGAGVNLRSPNFGGADSLRFESGGTPLAGGSVGVQASGSTWKLQVENGTGRVTITS